MKMQEKDKIKDFLSGSWAGFFGGNENENKTEENYISPEERAEVAVEELRNKYSAKVKENFDLAAKKLREERDNALRENWILQQRAEAALPEQMAASGINGGASESSLANLRAQYQGNRNDIQSGYMDNLGELEQERAIGTAEAEKSYNERWLEYLLSLAEAEKTAKYKK